MERPYMVSELNFSIKLNQFQYFLAKILSLFPVPS
jgi:hypothetical protein